MSNIIIKEDKSYLSEVDLQAIKKGIAELGIHAIRLDREFTEEQKQKNRLLADSMNREEWAKHCKQSKKRTEKQIEKIIDTIHDNFMIYQYKDKDVSFSNDDWDLFFWCNQGDMSYVRLNPNEKRSNEQQIKDIEKVIELVKTIDCEGIRLSIQYTVHYNESKTNEIVRQVYDTIKDTFISYMGTEGRIKEVGENLDGQTVYGFFKKRARSKYFSVSNKWFLQWAFNNKLQ